MCIIGGDATSQKEDVKQEKGHDLFRLIANALSEFKPEYRLDNSNPSVTMSIEFFNSILSDNAQRLTYGVDKSCSVAIQDYENTKEDKNGKIDKKPIKDPITKISYQPFGHIIDLTRYFICTVFAKENHIVLDLWTFNFLSFYHVDLLFAQLFHIVYLVILQCDQIYL